ALGDVRQRLAERHVGEHAWRIDAGEAAPLDLARRLQRHPPPTGHGHEADCLKLLPHRVLLPTLRHSRGATAEAGIQPQGWSALLGSRSALRLAGMTSLSGTTAVARSRHLFQLLERADDGRHGTVGEARLPVGVGDLAHVDVAAGIDGQAVRGDELAGLQARSLLAAEPRDQLAVDIV